MVTCHMGRILQLGLMTLLKSIRGYLEWKCNTKFTGHQEKILQYSESFQDCYKLYTSIYDSPLILRASCMSLGWIVTLLPCMAQRLVSSYSPTMYASVASCKGRVWVSLKLKINDAARKIVLAYTQQPLS
jgi:hypothetical protein